MNELNLQKGFKVGQFELQMLRRLLADTLQEYIGLRKNTPGIVMKTDTDTSFEVTINPTTGEWSVAAGYIINHEDEIIHNPINGLIPVSGLEPGGLTAGANPIVDTGTAWYIIVQTGISQNKDYGTIAVTGAANTVVGTNTEFTKYFQVGGVLNIPTSSAGNEGDYIIENIADDTHLTVAKIFNATESGLKFKAHGVFFEGYPSGGDKSLYNLNSFTFRVSDSDAIADGEYILARADYDTSWSITDYRSNYRFSIPVVNNIELNDLAITLGKMAVNSVDENKIVNTMFGAGLEGGSGTKPKISDLGVVTAMIDNLAVTLDKMAPGSVDENKVLASSFDAVTVLGGGGTKFHVIEQTKFFAYLQNGSSITVPTSILTVMNLDAELYDINNRYSTTNGRFTPTAGYYHIDALIYFDSFVLATTEYIEIVLAVSGAASMLSKRIFGNGQSNNWCIGLSADFYTDGMDFYDIRVLQTTSSSQTVLGAVGTGNFRTKINAHKLL